MAESNRIGALFPAGSDLDEENNNEKDLLDGPENELRTEQKNDKKFLLDEIIDENNNQSDEENEESRGSVTQSEGETEQENDDDNEAPPSIPNETPRDTSNNLDFDKNAPFSDVDMDMIHTVNNMKEDPQFAAVHLVSNKHEHIIETILALGEEIELSDKEELIDDLYMSILEKSLFGAHGTKELFNSAIELLKFSSNDPRKLDKGWMTENYLNDLTFELLSLQEDQGEQPLSHDNTKKVQNSEESKDPGSGLESENEETISNLSAAEDDSQSVKVTPENESSNQRPSSASEYSNVLQSLTGIQEFPGSSDASPLTTPRSGSKRSLNMGQQTEPEKKEVNPDQGYVLGTLGNEENEESGSDAFQVILHPSSSRPPTPTHHESDEFDDETNPDLYARGVDDESDSDEHYFEPSYVRGKKSQENIARDAVAVEEDLENKAKGTGSVGSSVVETVDNAVAEIDKAIAEVAKVEQDKTEETNANQIPATPSKTPVTEKTPEKESKKTAVPKKSQKTLIVRETKKSAALAAKKAANNIPKPESALTPLPALPKKKIVSKAKPIVDTGNSILEKISEKWLGDAAASAKTGLAARKTKNPHTVPSGKLRSLPGTNDPEGKSSPTQSPLNSGTQLGATTVRPQQSKASAGPTTPTRKTGTSVNPIPIRGTKKSVQSSLPTLPAGKAKKTNEKKPTSALTSNLAVGTEKSAKSGMSLSGSGSYVVRARSSRPITAQPTLTYSRIRKEKEDLQTTVGADGKKSSKASWR